MVSLEQLIPPHLRIMLKSMQIVTNLIVEELVLSN